MITAASRTQSDLFREYLMARARIDPHEYGIDLNIEEFRIRWSRNSTCGFVVR